MYLLLTHSNLHYVYVRLRSLTWLKPALRVGIVGLVVCFVVVLAQLIYPTNRALPFANIQGKHVGFESVAQIKTELNGLDNREVTIKTEKRAYTTSFESIGVRVNAEAMAKTASTYPTKLRFVPFSLLLHRPRIYKLDLTLQETALNSFASKVMEENFAAA